MNKNAISTPTKPAWANSWDSARRNGRYWWLARKTANVISTKMLKKQGGVGKARVKRGVS